MPNEIRIQAGLFASKAGIILNPPVETQAVDMAGEDIFSGTFVATGTASALSFGGITGNPAAILIVNKDAVNNLSVGFANPPTEMILRPGVPAMIPGPAGTVFVRSSASSTRYFIAACEA